MEERKERRKFVRFKAPFCIQYSNADSSREFSGVIKDISMGGTRVLLDTPLDVSPQSLASLAIFLPENTLKVSGEAVWARDFGEKKEIGVCFKNIPDAHKEDIYSHIFKYFREEITRKWWQK